MKRKAIADRPPFLAESLDHALEALFVFCENQRR
jgi:hypothetical protein